MMLRVKDLNVYYDAIHALKNVSFEVNEGEIDRRKRRRKNHHAAHHFRPAAREIGQDRIHERGNPAEARA